MPLTFCWKMRIAATFLVVVAFILATRIFVTQRVESHNDERANEAAGQHRIEPIKEISEGLWFTRERRRAARATESKVLEFKIDEDATTNPDSMSEFLSSGPITVRRMYEVMGSPRGAVDAGFGDISFAYLASEESGLFVSVDSGDWDSSRDLEEVPWSYDIVSIQSFTGDSIKTIWRRDPDGRDGSDDELPDSPDLRSWSETPFESEDPFTLEDDAERTTGGDP